MKQDVTSKGTRPGGVGVVGSNPIAPTKNQGLGWKRPGPFFIQFHRHKMNLNRH